MDIQKKIVSAAADLAKDIDADAVLALTESGKTCDFLSEQIEDQKLIALTPNEETQKELSEDSELDVINFTVRDPSRTEQIRHAIWRGLNDGLLSSGEVVVCLVGEVGSSQGTDTISVYLISEAEPALAGVIETDSVLSSVLEVSSELGSEGREGEPVGTAFIVGDAEKVMNQSNQLGLNPFRGYEDINIIGRDNWELIKRYAFLDGAFVLDEDGGIVATGRYLGADVDVDVPQGLGTRHMAVLR